MNTQRSFALMPSAKKADEAVAPLGGAVVSSTERLASSSLTFDSQEEKDEAIAKGIALIENILKTEKGITDIQFRTGLAIRTQRGSEMGLYEGHGKTSIHDVLGVALALYRSRSGLRDRRIESVEEEDEEMIAKYTRHNRVDFAAEGGGIIDTVISTGRLRVHVFFEMRGMAITVRILGEKITPLAELGFTTASIEELKSMIRMRNGLGLVVGQTASGKSTTLAALIDFIRINSNVHIVTIEEPVEYRIPDTLPNGDQSISLVTQREVGLQVDTYDDGLSDALREHPNVLMIGEIRNEETMRTCLAAAQTGHCVLATLHANGATETLDRILDFFEPVRAPTILNQLASTLNFVLTQGLFASQKKPGSYALVYELFLNKRIESRGAIMKFHINKSSIESEMQTAPNVRWDDNLTSKKEAGEISKEDADINRRRTKPADE